MGDYGPLFDDMRVKRAFERIWEFCRYFFGLQFPEKDLG